jgi:hypothetical protein
MLETGSSLSLVERRSCFSLQDEYTKCPEAGSGLCFFQIEDVDAGVSQAAIDRPEF